MLRQHLRPPRRWTFLWTAAFGFPTPAPAAETPAEEDDFGLSRLDFTDTPATFDTPATPAAPATPTPPDDDFGRRSCTCPPQRQRLRPPAVTEALPRLCRRLWPGWPGPGPPSSRSTEAETADSNDPLNTKLDLAQEFAMIGDSEGARTLIEEVLSEARRHLENPGPKNAQRA